MVSSNNTSTRFVDDLLTQWRNPAGGRDDIGTFNIWFMNAAWDDLMASDSASERLGWDIYGTLKQYNDFPDRVPHSWVREQIDRAILDYGIASASASDMYLLDLLSQYYRLINGVVSGPEFAAWLIQHADRLADGLSGENWDHFLEIELLAAEFLNDRLHEPQFLDGIHDGMTAFTPASGSMASFTPVKRESSPMKGVDISA
jgi:hypothetical protein